MLTPFVRNSVCEDIHHTIGMKDLYVLKEETIERIFGSAKEYHGFRYTQMFGKARMRMKVGLTYTCINLKKLTKMKVKIGITRNDPEIKTLKTNCSIRIRWFLPCL